MAPNVYKHFSEIYSSLGVIFKEMMVQRPQHRWLAKVVIFNHKKSERIENLLVHRGYAKGIIIVKVKICLSHSLHHRSSVHAGYVYSVQCQSMIVTYINALVLISTQRFLLCPTRCFIKYLLRGSCFYELSKQWWSIGKFLWPLWWSVPMILSTKENWICMVTLGSYMYM